VILTRHFDDQIKEDEVAVPAAGMREVLTVTTCRDETTWDGNIKIDL
jgi:hypothetical protein